MNTKEEHIQELRRLKDLATVPSVQKVLEDLISENREMREPIKRSKAQIQTIFITTGFAWNQTPTSIVIYVNFKDAGTLSKDNCSINTTPRSLEFNIAKHKIVIILTKKTPDSVWLDLRMKSTQKTYQELERYEKINDLNPNNVHNNNHANFDTPFKEGSYCSHHPVQEESG
ncbi:hypothetical protein MUCCIDRAFT_109282 [Mucor lusitanicus CBS 277.49]|uniref:CS domain-containing protein n=1 Tax=Mucor lusitanicus CBS 277.49 TaxID=747725 RepID=A0A168MVH3_MUCCL|nr:hypothetical protein MUCCIDRAFT_109282 [Mucor lusitanicus CBS 277.49]